ncbi:MAG: phage tail assembly chaperone [Candidatus Marinimicrobia bacterium]|nr:phage tail assembly chaperone [Candidatus Neomarinimicrobiota bacterium]
MSQRTILIQFYAPEKIIFYNNKPVTLSSDDIQEFLNSFPDSIHNAGEKLEFFTYFTDDTYKSEKRKRYYDFRSKTYKETVIDYGMSVDDANYLVEQLKILYEKYRLLEVDDLKEKLKSEIFNMMKKGVDTRIKLRNELLVKSDWAQIPDVPFDDDKRLMWMKYRQYLRDITSQDRFKFSTKYSKVFPIDPETFKVLFPECPIDQYLEIEDHFMNQSFDSTMHAITKTIEKLNLPSVDVGNIDKKNYINFINSLNQILYKVGLTDIDLIAEEVNSQNEPIYKDSSIKIALSMSGQSEHFATLMREYIKKSGKYTNEEIELYIDTVDVLTKLEFEE